MNQRYTVHMDTIMSFLSILTVLIQTHNKTCPLQKSKTFWHLSFFFMASGFLFKNVWIYIGLVLLVVESHWQSPYSVFTVLRHQQQSTYVVFCYPLFSWGLRQVTSEVSPSDLLVNCAITRSTNLSISCHISNVACTVGWRAVKSLQWPWMIGWLEEPGNGWYRQSVFF